MTREVVLKCMIFKCIHIILWKHYSALWYFAFSSAMICWKFAWPLAYLSRLRLLASLSVSPSIAIVPAMLRIIFWCSSALTGFLLAGCFMRLPPLWVPDISSSAPPCTHSRCCAYPRSYISILHIHYIIATLKKQLYSLISNWILHNGRFLTFIVITRRFLPVHIPLCFRIHLY